MFEKYSIGLDLDGTLVDYGHLFLCLAQEAGLVTPELWPGMQPNKSAVRDFIRLRHGDVAWQGLQALAYGERLCEARLFDDVLDTLHTWRKTGCSLAIVSHKSRYTSLLGESGPDLHYHSRLFLRQSGILDFISEKNVFFCSTRQTKCCHIAKLGCDVFVDDLPEVFSSTYFPEGTKKVLFLPTSGESAADSAMAPETDALCRHWHEMDKAIALALEQHV